MQNLDEIALHPLLDPVHAIAEFLVETACRLIPERPFHPYQREFAFAVVLAILRVDPEEITALFSRQSGKTETMARVAVVLAIFLPYLGKRLPSLHGFRKGFWVGIFAPVKDQAKTSFERMIEALESKGSMAVLRKAKIGIKEKNSASRVLSNGSFIRIWSASPGSNIESKTLHLAILEESQDITQRKIRKSIEPMLTSTAGSMVHVGTANGTKSTFWETIERNKRLQADESTRRLHFQYDWTVIIKHNPRYRAFLNKKVLDRGRQWVESDEFKMAYGCKFILERGQFISFERFMELRGLCASVPRGPYGSGGKCLLRRRIVAGIDWGKSSDSTVVTLIAVYEGFCQIVDWLEIVGDDYDSQFDSIVSFLERYPTLDLVLAETNGVGDPMTDRLKKAFRKGKLKAPVEGFWASETNNSDANKNLLIDMVNANRLLIPADEEALASREFQRFEDQMLDVTKEWRGSLLACRAPEDKDGESELHDDYFASLRIAYWAATKLSSSGVFDKFYGNKGA